MRYSCVIRRDDKSLGSAHISNAVTTVVLYSTAAMGEQGWEQSCVEWRISPAWFPFRLFSRAGGTGTLWVSGFWVYPRPSLFTNPFESVSSLKTTLYIPIAH
jgi:hypothetical protein